MFNEFNHQKYPKSIIQGINEKKIVPYCIKCNDLLSVDRIKKYLKNEYCGNIICKKCYMKSDTFKQLQKQRMQQKYADINIKKEILNKRKKTNLKKYGYEWAQQNTDVINKQKEERLKTLNNKYGVNNIMEIDEIKNKAYINMKNSIINKYKVSNIMKIKEIKDKAINKQKITNFQKYGVRNIMQINDYAKKHAQKILKIKRERGTIHNKKISKSWKFFWNRIQVEEWKYHTPKFMADPETKKKILQNRKNKYGTIDLNEIKSKYLFENKYNFLINSADFTPLFNKDDFNYKGEYPILCKKCNNEFYSDLRVDSNKNVYVYCPFCYIKQPFENNFLLEIKKFYGGEIVRHKRIGEKGKEMYEMDLFIPEFNFGIELNGLFWHNELNKHKLYHKQKQEFFEKHNIQVLHFWEDEINTKLEIILDIIKRKLLLLNNKIYARETTIRELNIKEYREFLNNNHLLGYSYSKHRFGLFKNDELLCLIGINQPRTYMNQSEMELVRYAIKKDYLVLGGFNKLLNYIKKQMSFKKLISFCDPLKFNGHIYENANFSFIKWSEPGFWWTNNINRFYRFKYPGNSGYNYKLNKIYDAGMKKYCLTI